MTKTTDTIQQLIQNLGQRLPDAQYQDAYVAHMDVLSEALKILSKTREPTFAPSMIGMTETAETQVEGQDDGWQTVGLPEPGDEVEIELANGEILAGVVAGFDHGGETDLLIQGPMSAPKRYRISHLDEWWTGTTADDALERRVRWRMKPAKPAAKTPDDWRSDGLPEIGDTVEIELGTGEVVSGEVTELDLDLKEGDTLDLRIGGPMSRPTALRWGYDSDVWWTGAANGEDRRRRVRWRKIQNP